MLSLNSTDLTRITTKMTRIARPLDVMLWHVWCGTTDWSDVLQPLSAFQNNDGGFGHGIEPDM